jgi:hypothetical protein
MSALQNESLNVKLVNNKQRDRQRGKSVVNSSRFTHFICHNGSEAFVPFWSTRSVFEEVPLRLNVGLLFYPVVVVETILLLQQHFHCNIEHDTKLFLSCASLFIAIKTISKRNRPNLLGLYVVEKLARNRLSWSTFKFPFQLRIGQLPWCGDVGTDKRI